MFNYSGFFFFFFEVHTAADLSLEVWSTIPGSGNDTFLLAFFFHFPPLSIVTDRVSMEIRSSYLIKTVTDHTLIPIMGARD